MRMYDLYSKNSDKMFYINMTIISESLCQKLFVAYEEKVELIKILNYSTYPWHKTFYAIKYILIWQEHFWRR